MACGIFYSFCITRVSTILSPPAAGTTAAGAAGDKNLSALYPVSAQVYFLHVFSFDMSY